MVDAQRISARQYYDFLPAPEHRCGDIWTHLPTFGLLANPFLSALIISPACDLSNNKTEAITYLPIVPIPSYFRTTAALPLIRRQIQKKLGAARFKKKIDLGTHDFLAPTGDAIRDALATIQSFLEEKKRGEAEIAALNASKTGLQLLAEINSPSDQQVDLKELFGKEWQQQLRQIMTNSFSTSLHFLPRDEQQPLFSGVHHHSVVLFRYPLTIPITVLDFAREATELSWQEILRSQNHDLPALQHFSPALPVKVLSLQPRFLSDLLSRYLAVYGRIGSPDFTAASLDRMVAEVTS